MNTEYEATPPPDPDNALAPSENADAEEWDSEADEGARYEEGGEEAPDGEAAEAAPAGAYDPETEALARELGWKPKSEWKGDTSGWVDLDRFMELPATLRKANARMARELAQVRAATVQGMKAQRERMEREKADEIARIRKEMRAAVEVGDAEKWEELEARREKLANPQPEAPASPPLVDAYRARNEWAQDPVKWAAAVQAVDIAVRSGAITSGDPAEQLAYAERAVRETYPHWFANQPAPAPRRPAVQRVDGGSPVAPSKQAAKGWNQIPAEERRDLQGLVGSVFKTKEEAAAAYWEEYK